MLELLAFFGVGLPELAIVMVIATAFVVVNVVVDVVYSIIDPRVRR